MLFHRKKKPMLSYDRDRLEPVIRCSICTGEQVAGFRDRATGQFHEDRLLRSPQDLEDFQRDYGIPEPPVIIY